MNLDGIRSLENRFHMHVYGRQPVAFARGEGAWLWDTDGKQYLDFLGGIAVMSVGHSHPKVVEAIREQTGTLTHVSNLFYTEPQVLLAERLHDLLGWGKVFFSNSGAEANECALKLARRWARGQGSNDRSGVVVALGSFHGRTFTTLAATGQPHKHEAFAPLPAWFTYVPLNDEDALDRAVGDGTTAVMLEVVQGEGGVRLATPEYLAVARKFCEERGAALIFDEVQTGLGRTGKWFAFEHHDVVPDIVTLAKALGGGLPIGACIARDDVADAFRPGDHATTFGGGPVPCMAALAVLDVIESEGLVARAAASGEKLRAALADGTSGNKAVTDVRGLGLLIAIELAGDWAADVVGKALHRGLVVNSVTPNAIRLAPPLIVSDNQIEQAAEILCDILAGYGGAP
ncbi:MAG TPA: acetylornithine transaminase [Actinomycetota bacterium]|nr:acetylornithine transaminase [Actinomycetota bacterium]